MLKINKPVVLTLLGVFSVCSVMPAHAGYYKTVYVEDTPQKTVVINNYVEPTKTVVVHETSSTYQDNPALAILGVGALVGGVILGANMHKKHSKHKHFEPPRKNNGHHHKKR